MIEKYSNEALEIKNKAEKIKEKGVTKDEVKSLDLLKTDVEKLKDSETIKKELKNLLDEIKSQAKNTDLLNDGVLANISNKDFLKTPKSERLQNVTNGNTKYEDIENGTVKNIEFKFNFNGKLNKELYLKTTLGQLLPPNISEVTSNGQTYTRKGLAGEFFNKDNKRLIIHDKTQIEIGKTKTAEEIKEIETKNLETFSSYIKEHPTANKEITKEAIARGIDVNFAIIAFQNALDKEEKEEDKKALLEDMFTQFDRLRSAFRDDGTQDEGKYNMFVTFSLIKKYNPENWKDLVKQLKYNDSEIKDFEDRGDDIPLEDDILFVDDGNIIGGEPLLKDKDFGDKLIEVCSNLGIQEEALIAVMRKESGLNPKAINPYNGASGLIQFTKSTAAGLGTSVQDLRRMTGAQQLIYVEKYLSAYKPFNDYADVFLAVFYPAAKGKSDDYVLFSRGTSGYTGNKGMDKDKKGYITKKDVANFYN